MVATCSIFIFCLALIVFHIDLSFLLAVVSLCTRRSLGSIFTAAVGGRGMLLWQALLNVFLPLEEEQMDLLRRCNRQRGIYTLRHSALVKIKVAENIDNF